MLTGLKGEILFSRPGLPQGQSDQKHPWTKDSWPQSQDGHMIPSEILVVFFGPAVVFPFCLAMSQEWKRQEGGRGWNAGNGSEDRSRT